MARLNQRPIEADWWRRWESIHEREREAFKRHGVKVHEKHAARGSLVLEIEWPGGDDGFIQLVVGYSPMHPFARPTITAPKLDLERHQNRFTKALCLITQDTKQWDGRQAVADFIAERLAEVFKAVEARAEGRWVDAAEVEEQAADPFENYFASAAEGGWAIYYGADQAHPPTSYGALQFGLQPRPFFSALVEGVIRSVAPINRSWAAPAFNLANVSEAWQEGTGRWVRMTPPLSTDPKELLKAAEREIAALTALMPADRQLLEKLGDQNFALTGILFEDEIRYPGGRGPAWLFLVKQREGKRETVKLVRGFRITEDLKIRVPVAGALKNKKVLLIGCGALGSFVAVELARAGIGKLTLIDHDIVEPGNSVRWALGRESWGLPKVNALQLHLLRHYPDTRVEPLADNIGAAFTRVDMLKKSGRDPLLELRQQIADADLVIDASASSECETAIAHECRDLGKPLVVGFATEGAVGGTVARFVPGSPACWVCLHEHWDDGALSRAAEDRSRTVVPIGCNKPTFAGGAFDLQEVSLEMVRTAIGLLEPDGYDPGGWQLAVLDLVADGRRALPRWRDLQIGPHPRCGCSR